MGLIIKQLYNSLSIKPIIFNGKVLRMKLLYNYLVISKLLLAAEIVVSSK